MDRFPKISIVTPTYNQGQFIEQSIVSVINQNYPNLEYIIIDGGSTDSTVETIKKYSKHLTYWVSEKDKGQPDAINKGLKLCTGDIFNWLNSDDYLEPNALIDIAQGFANGAQLVAGRVRVFEEDGGDGKTVELVQHAGLTAKRLMYWTKGVKFVQPGVWLRRSLVQKCGGIDNNFQYCFDWDLYIRYLSLFPKVEYSNKLFIHFRYHRDSKTVSCPERFHDEEVQIIQKLTLQVEDKTLRRIAKAKWAEKRWLPLLNESIEKKGTSRLIRITKIIKGINSTNIRLWRATAGAIRLIINS